MAECDLVTVEAVPTVATRASVRREEIPNAIRAGLDPIWKFIRTKPELKFGFNVVVYLEGPKRMEIGVQLPGEYEVPAGIIRTQSPAGLAARAVHWGSYAELGRTYDAIHAWMKANKLKPTGPFWELYGHWNDDPAKLRTDIYYLVERLQ